MPVVTPSVSEVRTLKLSEINRNGGTQARVGLNEEKVLEYQDVVRAGQSFRDKPLAFHDGEANWLADGFHRYEAFSREGVESIEVEVLSGTLRDALLYAIGANADHGLPRSIEDKKRAVKLLLDDPEWSSCSTNWLADKAKVSRAFVDKQRPPVDSSQSAARQIETEPARRVCRNGKAYPVPRPPASNQVREEQQPDPAADQVPESWDDEVTEPEAAAEESWDDAPDDAATDSPKSPVPERLASVFEKVSEFRGIVRGIGELWSRIEALAKTPAGKKMHVGALQNAKVNLQDSVTVAAPVAVCPSCVDRDNSYGCKQCGERGWLDKSAFSQLPPELKEKATRYSTRAAA